MERPPAKNRLRAEADKETRFSAAAVVELMRDFGIIQGMREAALTYGVHEDEVDQFIAKWWMENLEDLSSLRHGRPRRDWPMAVVAFALRESGWSLRQIQEWLSRLKVSYGHAQLSYAGEVEKPYFREARRWVAAGETEMRKRMGSTLFSIWRQVLRKRRLPRIGETVETPEGRGVVIGLATSVLYGELRTKKRHKIQTE